MARFRFLIGSALALMAFSAFLPGQSASPFKLAAPAEQSVPGEAGRVFVQTATGLVRSKSSDGRVLWERSLLEEFGVQIDPAKALVAPILGGSELLVLATRPGATGLQDYMFAFDIETGELTRVLPSTDAYARPLDAAGPSSRSARATALRVVPAEFSLQSGQSKVFDVVSIDQAGREVALVDEPEWELLPAGFAMEDSLAAEPPSTEIAFDAYGKMEIMPETRPRVFRLRATDGKLSGLTVGRVLPDLPIYNSFESMPGAEPPAYWIGARWSWKVVALPDKSGLAMQPQAQPGVSTVYLGSVGMSEYTVQADLHLPAPDGMTPGALGLVNERFMAVVEMETGNLSLGRLLEYPTQVAPLVKEAGVWTVQFRVEADPAEATQALLRARAWLRSGPKPAEDSWQVTAKLPITSGSLGGAPGLLQCVTAASPVFVDNVRVMR